MTYPKAAELAYDVLRAYRNGLGEAKPAWAALPQADQDKCISRVRFFVLNTSMVETIHVLWLHQKFLDGWTYGPVYQPAMKKTPYFVPWGLLPAQVRARGELFASVINSVRDQLPKP